MADTGGDIGADMGADVVADNGADIGADTGGDIGAASWPTLGPTLGPTSGPKSWRDRRLPLLSKFLKPFSQQSMAQAADGKWPPQASALGTPAT